MLTFPDRKGNRTLKTWHPTVVRPGIKKVSDFLAPKRQLSVGEISGRGASPRPIVSGFVNVGGCDWRGGAHMDVYQQAY